MRAKDVLLRALQEFTGTVVFVSHDRYFLEQLATRVIEVGGGEVHSFPGSYLEFQASRNGAAPVVLSGAVAAETAPIMDAVASAKGVRVNPIKLRQMKERLVAIEEEVSRLEAEIADRERGLADFQSVEQTIQANNLVTARRGDLENLLHEWEEVSSAIEMNS
jgi:ATP-binding cassette subfamily F protein 3